jgi:hypothetical protein
MKKLLLVPALCLPLALAACDIPNPPTAIRETRAAESNQQRLMETLPPPQLDWSAERSNLIERLARLNRQNFNGYIYLVSYGKIMAYYPVRGKVSSLNSYLTSTSQIVDDPHGSYDAGGQTLEAPDLDGTYGENDRGVFFFTTNGAYVEWKGEYLWSDQPLQMTQQPELVVNLTK